MGFFSKDKNRSPDRLALITEGVTERQDAPTEQMRRLEDRRLPGHLYGLRVSRIYLMPGEQRLLHAADSRGTGKRVRFSWSSGDPQIAEVDQKGVITGRKNGTTVITLTTGQQPAESVSLQVVVTDMRMVAHRGLCTEAPENSFAAVELAGEAGFWGVEVDVWETKPDEKGNVGFILGHDKTLEKMCGRAERYDELTFEELKGQKVNAGLNAGMFQQNLCTLEQFLDLCLTWDMVPFIDIKNKAYSDKGIRTMLQILENRHLLEKVHIVSRRKGTQSRMRKEAKKNFHTELKIQMNSRTGIHGGIPVIEQAQLAHKKGFAGISLHYRDMSEEIDRYAKEHQMIINLWPLREEQKEEMERLIREYEINSIMAEGVF